MNEKLYNDLMHHRPSQQQPEWKLFLQLCELYLERNKIERPIVVEIGCLRSKQRKFYEQLFDAEHISIDIRAKGSPTILGNSHLPQTMMALRKKLDEVNGPHELGSKPIDILFIDAGHAYSDIRQDFDDYGPLCSGIIAIHDIEIGFPRKCDVRFFWNELKQSSKIKGSKYADSMFISLFQYSFERWHRSVGLGMVIQK